LAKITKNIDVECDAVDCGWNNRAFITTGFCTGHCKITKGMCIGYGMDKEHMEKTLKTYLHKRVKFDLPSKQLGAKQWSEG